MINKGLGGIAEMVICIAVLNVHIKLAPAGAPCVIQEAPPEPVLINPYAINNRKLCCS